MSEVRKPVATIRVKWSKVSHKFELFEGRCFAEFITGDQQLLDEKGRPTVRVRHNGVWMPPKERVLYPISDVMALIESALKPVIESTPVAAPLHE